MQKSNWPVNMGNSQVEGVEIVLYGTDTSLLEKLSQFSEDMDYILYQPGYGVEVVRQAKLDALWATLMVGIELFGAVPPFPFHEARVLETPVAQLQRGMPRYGIVGVATSQDDPKTPEFNLRLVFSALLDAVTIFNAKHLQPIRRVGILPEDLALKHLDPNVAFNVIREIYHSRSSTTDHTR